MAKHILAVQPLSRNDISILAELFEVSFDYYLQHNSPFFKEYLASLRTIIGLGFTAVLVDRSLLCIYQIYLKQFMGYKEGDFREIPGAKTAIAQSAAEMVGTAAICFSALQCPRYYEDFVVALHHAITKIPTLLNQQKEAERILALLSEG